jgi:hypothetical protein
MTHVLAGSLVSLRADDFEQAMTIAASPKNVRGFGPAKEKDFETFNKEWPGRQRYPSSAFSGG